LVFFTNACECSRLTLLYARLLLDFGRGGGPLYVKSYYSEFLIKV